MIEELQKKLWNRVNSNVNDEDFLYSFNLFDRSVTQKLWSTGYYCENLRILDINRFWVRPPDSDTQSEAGLTLTQAPTFDIVGYCRQFNLLLDGFFMNSMSTLDTLAHEISILYTFPQIPSNLYIKVIGNKLLQSHPNSKLSRFLNGQLGLPWYSKFEPYRHCTTHKSLIRLDDIKIRVDQVTIHVRVNKINLPDNPQARRFTYRKRREVTSYCQSILRRIQSLVQKVYENILIDIRRNNNVLPIQ